MKKYQLYLFDFDYTLVNSESAIVKCFHNTLNKTGLADCDDDTIRHTIGLPMRKAVKIITGTNDEAKVDNFVKAYTVEADLYMTAGTKFFPNTVSTLKELKNRGAKIGIISSKTSHRIKEKFVVDNVPQLVDYIIGSNEVQAHKPDPEGILKALAWFKIAPENVLYTGDSFVDAGAAQNAGVDFAGVTTGTTTAATLQNYPHITIMHDIAELLKI